MEQKQTQTPMCDIIIDAETLDTKDTAVIPSIGARLCNLETGEMGEGFHVKLNVQEQIDAGYTVNADTMGFWMNQGQTARDYLIAILQNKTPTVSRQVGFSMLHQFISCVKNANVWGNGISFDLGLCIREWGQDNLPWEFWNEQDVRTIVSFGRRVFGVQFKKEVQFEGTQHNPLDDATHEAQYLMEYFKHGRELADRSALLPRARIDLEDARAKLQEARDMMAQPAPSLDTACLEAIAKEQREVSELRQALDKAHARILELESPTCGTVDCSNLTAEEVAEIRNAMNSSPSVLLPTTKTPFPKDCDTMLKNIAGALGVSYDDIVASQRSAAKAVLRNHWQAYKNRKAELQAEEFGPELLESIADACWGATLDTGVILAMADESVWRDQDLLLRECNIELTRDITLDPQYNCAIRAYLIPENIEMTDYDSQVVADYGIPRIAYSTSDRLKLPTLRREIENAWRNTEAAKKGNPLDELTALDQEIAAECRDDGVELEGMIEDPAPAKYHSVHFHFAEGSDIAGMLEDFAETFVEQSKIFSELAAPEDADVVYTSSQCEFEVYEGQTVIYVDRPRPFPARTGSDLYECDLWDEWHQYSWTGEPAKPEALPTLYCLIHDASDEVVAAMWGVHRIKAANSVRALFDENDNLRSPVAMLYKEGSKVPSKLQSGLEAENIRLVPWYGSDMKCDDLPNSRLRARIIEASMPANKGAKE
jgi:hypothetical protein